MLEVRALSIAHAVHDVSFTVAAGEVLALTGEPGAGRTATLSALFGIARHAVGAIALDGQPLVIGHPRDAIAAGFAFVPADRKALRLVLRPSVGDSLALGALRRMSRPDAPALSRLADLSIKVPGLGAEVATLSGGDHPKMMVGAWLERLPRVVLLDEPTRGVDAADRAEIHALIEALCAHGAAIVLASSDRAEIEKLADRELVLAREAWRASA